MPLKGLWRLGWTAGSRQCQTVVVVLMDVVKEVCQPCLDIDSGKFAAAHHRVHHGGILGLIVALAEEVVLARLCWQLHYVDIAE